MKRLYQPITLGLVILLSFALRVVRLDFQPLWWDEGYSVFFATRDFQTMLARTAIDIHPPFYYAVMQIWMAVIGKDAVALRWLSVLIGVAAIPLLYALARKLFSDVRIALAAALILAISPFHIYYSQEVRMYGLVTLLGIASVYVFARLLPMKSGTPQTITLAATYIVVTAAALYTHYYAAFIIVFEILFAIWYIARNNKELLHWRSIQELWANPLVHWLGAWVAIGLLYLPWAVYSGLQLYSYVTRKVSHEAYAPLDPITFLAQHLAAFSIGHVTDFTWLAWVSITLIVFAILGIYVAIRGHEDMEIWRHGEHHLFSMSPALLVLFYLLIPLVLGYFVNIVYPFNPVHGERLLLLAAPAFYLFAAVGVIALWNRHTIVGALAVVVIGVISGASLYDFYTVPRYPNDDYRPLIQQIQQTAQPGDVFLAIYPWQIGYLESYYHGAPLTIIETPSDVWTNYPDQMRRGLDSLSAQHPRIWLAALQTLGHIVEDAIDANLRPHAYIGLDTWFGTTRLEMFATISDSPPSEHPLAFSTPLPLDAKHWGAPTNSIIAGQDLVPIWFDWGDNHSDEFKLSLRLIDSKGNLWAQDDRDVESKLQRIGFIVPTGTPPGKYDLRLVVYQSSNTSSKSEALVANVNLVSPAHPNLAAVPNRMTSDVGNRVRLIGYESGSIMRPGDPSPITLFWQATGSIDKDLVTAIQIQDSSGKVFASTQASPARGIYSTRHWQPNEIVRDPESITLRGDTPDGDYRIVAALIDPASNVSPRFVQVGNVTVKGRMHYFGTPSPSNKFDVRFGDVAQLIGYDISVDQPNVRIVLYWKALGATDTSYKVFVHLVDSSGNMPAQRDQIPGANAFPTTSWVKGEYLADVYDLTAPLGDYSISIGMYDPLSNSRLPSFDANNQPIGDNSVLPTRISVGR